MPYKAATVIIASLMFFFWGCMGSPASRESGAAAAAMDEAPNWTRNPYTAYDRETYFAAVGHGASRKEAEQAALAALTASFGQSIQADFNSRITYTEAVSRGAIQVSGNTQVQEAIKTSAALDSLIGAEIGEIWDGGAGTVYALAVMDKEKTAILYADMIRSNRRIITDLTAMTNAEKNSLEGYSRYRLAAVIADINRTYANILSLTGNSSGIEGDSFKNGDDYRLEAANITKAIPVTVIVVNDRADLIRGAFALALGTSGFRSGGNNSRYVLKVTVTLSEAIFSDKTYKYAQYVVDANLTDTADGAVLLPFNITGRETHANLLQAENLAIASAEKKIKDSYGQVLSEYLSALLPK